MAENKPDMFSALPDSLLFIIVSSLPFKEAARTMVLSRRWRRIWLSTKNIQLYESFFVNENNEDERANFINFAKNWIHNYQEPVAYKFEFAFSNPNETHLPDIRNFIKFAYTRIVKLLDLDFSDPNWTDECQEPIVDIPSLTEENRALEAIRLFSCKFIGGELRNFRALTSVSLGWISLTTPSLTALLTNCAQLEELSLKRCWGLKNVCICSSNIQILMIDKCLSLEDGVLIEALNLRVLKYSGSIVPFDLLDLDSLEKVDLDFGFEEEFNSDYGQILYGILSSISSVRVLTVCGYMLQVISTADEPLSLKPPFSMLQHLTLKTSLYPEEHLGVAFFLKSSQNLQTLSLELQLPRDISNEEQSWWLSAQGEHQFSGNSAIIIIYACMGTSLKTVEIKGFKGEISELLVLEYLINYGQVLENLLITISDEKGKNGEDLSSFYQSNAFEACALIKKALPNLNIVLV